MSEPKFSIFTERMYGRLPEVVREADSLNDYALKRYLSAIGDVQDQVDRLIARFDHLTLDEYEEVSRIDDLSYYRMPDSYFQTAESYNSAILSPGKDALYLMSDDRYRVVPGATIYSGAMIRTPSASVTNTYGLRLWYYNANMELVTVQNVAENTGATGPQWIALNATTIVPENVDYVTISPFVKNTSGAKVDVWVDNVSMRSNYVVSSTVPIVSKGYAFNLRRMTELVVGGNLYDLNFEEAIAAWNFSPNTVLDSLYLENEDETIRYRSWCGWDYSPASEPRYLRQVVRGFMPNTTYALTFTAARGDDLPDGSHLRVTITPDTGGAATHTYDIDWEPSSVDLFEWVWTSPDIISTAILGFELILPSDPSPTAGKRMPFALGHISMSPHVTMVSQVGQGTKAVTQLVNLDSVSSAAYDADTRTFAPVPSYPSAEYVIRGSYTTNDPSIEFDVWIDPTLNDTLIPDFGGLLAFHIKPAALGTVIQFERVIKAPPQGTGFIVSVEPSGDAITFGSMTLTPRVPMSWHKVESTPFAFDMLSTRVLQNLRNGDVLTYVATLRRSTMALVEDGKVGVRFYSGNTVVHETMVHLNESGEMTTVRGTFEVHNDNQPIRATIYVDEPLSPCRAGYMLQDFTIAQIMRERVTNAENLLVNPGFEANEPMSHWTLMTEMKLGSETSYFPVANPGNFLTVGVGYNRDEVPDRPVDLPLGKASDLVNPRTANTGWLPWIAQFTGQDLASYKTMEEFRTVMSDVDNAYNAGTAGSIASAVQSVLSGTKTVRVFPLTTDVTQIGKATQWDVLVVTRTSESPSESVMQAAVDRRKVKPAGVVLHYASHQSSWDAIEIANPDWNTWDTKTWTQIEESGLGS